VPVLAGYALLEARGAALDTNASYDAYKLFLVFYPCLLPGILLVGFIAAREPADRRVVYRRSDGGVRPRGQRRGGRDVFLADVAAPLLVSGELSNCGRSRGDAGRGVD